MSRPLELIDLRRLRGARSTYCVEPLPADTVWGMPFW